MPSQYSQASPLLAGYPAMAKALNKTGRPIMYSCSWPAYIKDVSMRVINQVSAAALRTTPASTIHLSLLIRELSLPHFVGVVIPSL